MKHCSAAIKQQVLNEHQQGASIRELSLKYGASRYSIASWCGLRKEVELRHAAPLRRGRPKQQPQNLEQRIKRLEMENELLRSFLSAVGRK